MISRLEEKWISVKVRYANRVKKFKFNVHFNIHRVREEVVRAFNLRPSFDNYQLYWLKDSVQIPLSDLNKSLLEYGSLECIYWKDMAKVDKTSAYPAAPYALLFAGTMMVAELLKEKTPWLRQYTSNNVLEAPDLLVLLKHDVSWFHRAVSYTHLTLPTTERV